MCVARGKKREHIDRAVERGGSEKEKRKEVKPELGRRD